MVLSKEQNEYLNVNLISLVEKPIKKESINKNLPEWHKKVENNISLKREYVVEGDDILKEICEDMSKNIPDSENIQSKMNYDIKSTEFSK